MMKQIRRDYAAALSAADEKWSYHLPSGDDIQKQFPFLWPNRLIGRKYNTNFI
jgi:hypothetical protein